MSGDLVFGLKSKDVDLEEDSPRKNGDGMWKQVVWCDKVEK